MPRAQKEHWRWLVAGAVTFAGEAEVKPGRAPHTLKRRARYQNSSAMVAIFNPSSSRLLSQSPRPTALPQGPDQPHLAGKETGSEKGADFPRDSQVLIDLLWLVQILGFQMLQVQRLNPACPALKRVLM